MVCHCQARICINEETGKDTVTVRAEFKNFEKDPITISWAKCCVPLASLNFTELESHEPIVIAPLGSRHIEFEATLTPNMVEKAKEKFGSDNGIRGSFQFTIKATMKKIERSLYESKELMIELVQFKKHRTLSEADIKILITRWVDDKINRDIFDMVEFDKLDRILDLPPGTSKKHLKNIVAGKAWYQVDTEGDNYINFKRVYKKKTRRVISPGIQGY